MTIVGTLVGFVGAIYLPMSMLPHSVSSVLKGLPVLHGAAMMRTVCTKDAIAKTFEGLPQIASNMFREQMGVSVFLKNNEISLQFQLLIMVMYIITALMVSVWISNRRRLKDR